MILLLHMLTVLSWSLPILVIIIALIVSHKKEGNHARTEATMIVLCCIYYCSLSLYSIGTPVEQMTETFYRSFHSLVFILFARSLFDKLQFINQQRVKNAADNMVHNHVFSKRINTGGDRKSSTTHS